MTPSEGKDSDSSDSRSIYHSFVLTYSIDSLDFFPPAAVVVADFMAL